MGHGRQVTRAAWFVAVAAFAQNPAGLLERARDKVLAEAEALPKYICTETIDRSYYSRRERPEDPPSCERILVDRKKDRYHLKLDATDRLRVLVAIGQDREIYSWTGTAPYAHGVEDILQSGPIGTGAFAAHVLDIFSSPSARFRLVSERADAIEYGFRVPVEASHSLVGSFKGWLAAGYVGSVHIDKDSLDVRRLNFETDELPPETLMCQESTTLEFPSRQTAGSSWLAPSQSRTHDVMRDTTETDRVAALSDCHQSSAVPVPPPAREGAPLPAGLSVSLAFKAPIDTDVAAAGDAISATVTDPVYTGRKGKDAVVLPGSTVAGRIVLLRRQWSPQALFLIGVAFETLEADGVVSPFYAILIDPPPASEKVVYQSMMLTGHGLKDWPQGIFGFPPRQHLVVPASFKSKWLTASPGASQ
jgi:hypothetical protein